MIKNDRPYDDIIIWKSSKEDFNTNTQLIVMESEEALFVKDGIVVDTVTAGKHTLKTENFPFIEKLQRKIAGGVNIYSA